MLTTICMTGAHGLPKGDEHWHMVVAAGLIPIDCLSMRKLLSAGSSRLAFRLRRRDRSGWTTARVTVKNCRFGCCGCSKHCPLLDDMCSGCVRHCAWKFCFLGQEEWSVLLYCALGFIYLSIQGSLKKVHQGSKSLFDDEAGSYVGQ